MRSLPIGPQEAFILSRVDGSSTEADIALATGLDEDQVSAALRRLGQIGAVEYESAAAPAQPFAPTLPAFPAVDPSKPLLYAPSELDEDADLQRETKRRILDVFYQLEELSHYELLGVTEKAEKKAIKAAYYQVVNTFHPDRYFGKQLGTFKTKMEAVFARITVAHDTLTRTGPRKEYDEYLQSQMKTRHFDAMMVAQAPVVEAKPPVDAIRQEPEAQAVAASSTGTGAHNALGGRTFTPTRPSARRTTSDPEVRRRALARKLGGSANPGPRTSGTMPAVRAPVDRDLLKQQVEAGLKSRYASQISKGTAAQVEHYVKAAEQAARDKDPLSAANALRIASQLNPENEELAQRLADAQGKATAELADNYLEQAKYEEREGRLLKAAQNYERAALGKKSAQLYERAAVCLLQGAGELKHAAELAKRAVQMAPDHAEYHVTLSRVYAAAKMQTSAMATAERAVKLAPDNESAKKWLKRLKRGEF